MGIIDWPTPYFSNNALFKTKVNLPNGRGSTRRMVVPENEVKVLGLQDGDRVSVEMYDKDTDRSIAFETELISRSSGGSLRFTIPLRRVDLEPDEFDSDSRPQVVLRKTGVNKYFPQINPKRIYGLALFKRSAGLDMNENQSTLRYNIPADETEGLGLLPGDKVNVVMLKASDASGLENIKELAQGINRNVFRAELFDTGTGLSFSVKARLRRARGIDPDEIYQFILMPVEDS